MTRPFLDLIPTETPSRWRISADDNVCVGRRAGREFMFGGVGLGSAVMALERTCGRPLVWATAHYLSFARMGEMVDIEVTVHAVGNNVTQARAVSRVGDREILTTTASLGARDNAYSRQWVQAPEGIAPPERCGPPMTGTRTGLRQRLEIRVARGRFGYDGNGEARADGNLCLWIRPWDGSPIDAAVLAVIGDEVPAGIGNALGPRFGGQSLDNTVRIRRIVPTDWVLCDIRILGVHNGAAHGEMFVFAEDGELLAIGSQTVMVRQTDDDGNTIRG